jgi:hypothetical protein
MKINIGVGAMADGEARQRLPWKIAREFRARIHRPDTFDTNRRSAESRAVQSNSNLCCFLSAPSAPLREPCLFFGKASGFRSVWSCFDLFRPKNKNFLAQRTQPALKNAG